MPKPKLDATDIRILDILQRDGRATNQAIAESIALSPTPCLRRIRQLEQEGVIDSYVALLNPDAVGLSTTAFVRIRLSGQDDQHLSVFEDAVKNLPEVLECYLMTGEADYQLRVLVRSLHEFEDFLRQKLTRIPGVSQVTTSFALRPIVYRTAMRLDHLAE